jgi:cardiolipin synthase
MDEIKKVDMGLKSQAFAPNVTASAAKGYEKPLGQGKAAAADGQKKESFGYPLDEYVPTHDINDDTLDKIPPNSRKYFTPGNKVKTLFDSGVTPKDKTDDIFVQIEKLIKGAKSTIQVEMFNIDKKSIVDALIDEAKSGKKVQVIMDPPNDPKMESGKKDAIEKLRAGGVDVKIYPAKEAGSVEAKNGQLNHVKMMIVDGKTAVIGGMNWGEHSPANRDADVMVQGPAVDKMAWTFRKDWLASGGQSKDLPYIGKTEPRKDGDAMINMVTTSLDPNDKSIGISVNRAIQNAKKSIHAQLFVLTDRKTVANLINAHKKGLDVKVILNPLQIEDFKVNERAAGELADAGVPVRWFNNNPETKQKMHAKMATFDDDQAILGSANWTYAGFNINREADVEILSRTVSSDLDKVFKNDWKNNTTEKPVYLTHADTNAGG